MSLLHLFVVFIRVAWGLHRIPARHIRDDAAAASWMTSLFDIDTPDNRTYKPGNVSKPPKSLHGKNLVLIGDSNDRKFVGFLCDRYGAEVKFVTMMTCGIHRLSFPFVDRYLGYPSASRVCHLPAYNMTIMNLFHYGAMTTAPQPLWHSLMLRYRQPYNQPLPIFNTTTERVVASSDLVCFWRAAIASHLPQRPMVVVAQSSLWDSVLASTFLETSGLPPQLPQYGLQSYGWAQAKGLDAWNWIQHASIFAKAVRDGLGVEKLYWRTNPNCPANHPGEFVNVVAEKQAGNVRRAIRARAGVWRHVRLVDWREKFAAGRQDCEGVHYKENGFQAYMDALWAAL